MISQTSAENLPPDAYRVGTTKAAKSFVDGFGASLRGATDAINNGVKKNVQRFRDNLTLFAESPLAYMQDRRRGRVTPDVDPEIAAAAAADRKAKLGRAAMGGGMALSMASMAPMMMQDKQGKFMGMDAGTASMGMIS